MTEKISSIPDFVPEKPGTICIATDRTGHYTPPVENALRFIQEGDVAKDSFIPDFDMLSGV